MKKIFKKKIETTNVPKYLDLSNDSNSFASISKGSNDSFEFLYKKKKFKLESSPSSSSVDLIKKKEEENIDKNNLPTTNPLYDPIDLKISSKINKLFILRSQEIKDKLSYGLTDFFEFISSFDFKELYQHMVNLLNRLIDSKLYVQIVNSVVYALESLIKKDVLEMKKINDHYINKSINSEEKFIQIGKGINPRIQYDAQFRRLKKLENLKKKYKIYHKIFKLQDKLKERITSILNNKMIETNTFSYTERRYLVNYMKDIKSILIFDAFRFKLEKHEIVDLPYHFYRDSQGIEIYEDSSGILVFISGGGNSTYSQALYCYNVNRKQLETWETMSCSRGYHGMIAHNEFLYVIGGSNSSFGMSKFNKSVDIYNIRTKKRLLVTCEMNYPRSDAGLDVLDEVIYVVGGINYEKNDPFDIETLDTRNVGKKDILKWKTLSIKLPRAFFGPCCVAISNNELLIGGGENTSHKKMNELYIYDSKKDSLKPYFTCLPEGGEYINIGCFNNYRALFFDFNNDTGHDYSIHELNLTTKEWKTFRANELSK